MIRALLKSSYFYSGSQAWIYAANLLEMLTWLTHTSSPVDQVSSIPFFFTTRPIEG